MTGFSVVVVEDGTRGIADASIESETAEMKAVGVKIVPSGDIPRFGALCVCVRALALHGAEAAVA